MTTVKSQLLEMLEEKMKNHSLVNGDLLKGVFDTLLINLETVGVAYTKGEFDIAYYFGVDVLEIKMKDGSASSFFDDEKLLKELSDATNLHWYKDVDFMGNTKLIVNTAKGVEGWDENEEDYDEDVYRENVYHFCFEIPMIETQNILNEL